MTERRRPLGGVTKETYIKAGGDALTYDLMAGVRSDVCEEIVSLHGELKALRENCGKCQVDLEDKFIKKAFGKWPVSIVEMVAYLVILGILIGSAILDPKGLFQHIFKL